MTRLEILIVHALSFLLRQPDDLHELQISLLPRELGRGNDISLSSCSNPSKNHSISEGVKGLCLHTFSIRTDSNGNPFGHQQYMKTYACKTRN